MSFAKKTLGATLWLNEDRREKNALMEDPRWVYMTISKAEIKWLGTTEDRERWHKLKKTYTLELENS